MDLHVPSMTKTGTNVNKTNNFSLLEEYDQDYVRMSKEKLYDDEIRRHTQPVGKLTRVFTVVPGNYSVPMTPKVRGQPRLWMTQELLKEVYKRDSLFFRSKYHEPNNTKLRQEFMSQRNRCNRLLYKAKNKYTKQLYYHGTDELNETAIVKEVQSRRLNDVISKIMKQMKCPHCKRAFNEYNATLDFRFDLKENKFTMMTKNVLLRNGRTMKLKGFTKIPLY